MGFRDYNAGLNRFLSRDSYNRALADLKLGLDRWTGNRYAFGGGNPMTNIELDGHDFGDIVAAIVGVVGAVVSNAEEALFGDSSAPLDPVAEQLSHST